ncbi:hypothetical protein ACIBTZ_24795 [Micromonospora sp. NPDC049460]|uniref:hypothetical protein n=1 Tax=Micromonospora sp. NPDC049460 TaxID=3364272 RepID=UPI0037932663
MDNPWLNIPLVDAKIQTRLPVAGGHDAGAFGDLLASAGGAQLAVDPRHGTVTIQAGTSCLRPTRRTAWASHTARCPGGVGAVVAQGK